MKTEALKSLIILICIGIASISNNSWAVDERISAASINVVPNEDKEFNKAMSVWYSHRYGEAEPLLVKFAQQHPNSRWAAEAEMHVGCKAVFEQKFDEARNIFGKLVKERGNDAIGVKAKMRLGNAAELSANIDEAIKLYTEVMKAPLTWDQYRYCNFRSRILSHKRNVRAALINCGPVALSACLEAMNKPKEADQARSLVPDKDGDSLLKLQLEASSFGLPASAVEMSVAQLMTAELPLIAYVQPNHYIAVIARDGNKLRLKDSIRGDYAMALADLAAIWTGKAVVFSKPLDLQPLTYTASSETLGGCCGQFYVDGYGGCTNCPKTGEDLGGGIGGCSTGKCGGSRGYGALGNFSSGGGVGSPEGPTGGASGGFHAFDSPGRPTWDMRLCLNNIYFKDTPIWYNPGRGPAVGFTIAYTNENSDSGIFGNGCKTMFDTKVFFLPSGAAQSNIAQDLTPTSTIIYVYDAASFPPSGTVTVTYRTSADVQVSEKISYSTKIGNTLRDLTRGLNPISAPAGTLIYKGLPDIQVHREDGRVDTYKWDDEAGKYVCQSNIYGELVKVEMWKPDVTDLAGRVIVITFRDGSRCYYRSANEYSTALQGRVHVIEESAGAPITTLGQALADNSTEVVVADAAKLPAKGAILVKQTGEIISYTSKNGNTLTGITRAAQGTNRRPAGAGSDIVHLQRLTMNYDTSGRLQSITDATLGPPTNVVPESRGPMSMIPIIPSRRGLIHLPGLDRRPSIIIPALWLYPAAMPTGPAV